MSNELYKAQAARLVKYLSEHHKFRLKQSRSLEAIAAIHGMRNWNTLIAQTERRLPVQSDTEQRSVPPDAPTFDAGWSKWMPPARGHFTLPPLQPDAVIGNVGAFNAGVDGAVPESLTAVPPPTESDVYQLVKENLAAILTNVGPHLNETPPVTHRCGWRKGRRLYLLEIRFREYVLAGFPQNVRQWSEQELKRGLRPITKILLRCLAEKGWLVTEETGQKRDAERAVWNTQIGDLPFKGVIVVEIPEDLANLADVADSRYAISITEPLFPPEV